MQETDTNIILFDYEPIDATLNLPAVLPFPEVDYLDILLPKRDKKRLQRQRK